jgi:hypothetical protein
MFLRRANNCYAGRTRPSWSVIMISPIWHSTDFRGLNRYISQCSGPMQPVFSKLVHNPSSVRKSSPFQPPAHPSTHSSYALPPRRTSSTKVFARSTPKANFLRMPWPIWQETPILLHRCHSLTHSSAIADWIVLREPGPSSFPVAHWRREAKRTPTLRKLVFR